MATTLTKGTQQLREMQAYFAENPEWFARANATISEWGKGEKQLQYCIAESLKAAYEAGRKGIPIAAPKLQSIADDPPTKRLVRGAR